MASKVFSFYKFVHHVELFSFRERVWRAGKETGSHKIEEEINASSPAIQSRTTSLTLIVKQNIRSP